MGNPFLVAERAWSAEAGLERRIGRDISFGLTGFYRFSRDLIDYVITPAEDIPDGENLIPGGEYFYARNIGILDTWGLESWLSGQHSLRKALHFDWGISYQGLISRNDSAMVSKYLSAHARNLVQSRVGLRAGRFHFQLITMYKNRDAEMAREISRTLTPDYMVWNLRGDVHLFESRLLLSMQVNNLFDHQYADVLGAMMPGRWILGGFAWKFDRMNNIHR
jgi:iron complex outermembrane receptor protein